MPLLCEAKDVFVTPAQSATDTGANEPATTRGELQGCRIERPCRLQGQLIKLLRPGDSLVLTGGTYPGLLISDLHGSENASIRISAMAGARFTPDTGRRTANAQTRARRDTVEIRRSSHLEISRLVITGANRAGLRINNSHHITMTGLHVSDANTWGIYVDYSNSVRIYDSIVTGSIKQHGIYLANSGDGADIQRNFIGGHAGSGIHVNGDLSMGGAPGVPGDGLISDVRIQANWIDDVGETGGAGINLDGAVNVTVRHNVITGARAAGVTVFKGDGAAGSDRVVIDKNLIVGGDPSRDLLIFNNSGPHNTVSDNVLVSEYRKAAIIRVERDSDERERKAGTQESLSQSLPFTGARNVFWSPRSAVSFNGSTRRLDDVRLQHWGLLPGTATRTPMVTRSQSAYQLSTALTNLATLEELERVNPYVTGAMVALHADSDADSHADTHPLNADRE